MAGFTDIHAHLLPGIDDGPETLEGALEMARAAVEAGTTTLVATPHLRSDFPGVRVDEIAPRCEQLQGELDAAGIPLHIVSGGECSLMWALEASERELRQASFGGRGKDLLVETPGDVSLIDQLLYDLSARGLRVTLAHPERSPELHRHSERLESLRGQGVLLQVNAESLLTGGETRKIAQRLCHDGFAHVLASDGHRAGPRRSVGALRDGVSALTELVGAARADWMARIAPRAIVDGQDMARGPEISARRSRLWRRRHS